jgi:hypothetical protein
MFVAARSVPAASVVVLVKQGTAPETPPVTVTGNAAGVEEEVIHPTSTPLLIKSIQWRAAFSQSQSAPAANPVGVVPSPPPITPPVPAVIEGKLDPVETLTKCAPTVFEQVSVLAVVIPLSHVEFPSVVALVATGRNPVVRPVIPDAVVAQLVWHEPLDGAAEDKNCPEVGDVDGRRIVQGVPATPATPIAAWPLVDPRRVISPGTPFPFPIITPLDPPFVFKKILPGRIVPAEAPITPEVGTLRKIPTPFDRPSSTLFDTVEVICCMKKLEFVNWRLRPKGLTPALLEIIFKSPADCPAPELNVRFGPPAIVLGPEKTATWFAAPAPVTVPPPTVAPVGRNVDVPVGIEIIPIGSPSVKFVAGGAGTNVYVAPAIWFDKTSLFLV